MKNLYKKFLSSSGVCTDTRSIKKDCIFFALKGENFNGNRFASEALHQGAKYVVVDEQVSDDERIVLVNDVLLTLQKLATHHRKTFTIPFIAITGSNGKTTTKELVRAVLSQKYKTLATIGNLNNHIGVPLTILSITNEIEVAVIEMGANHIGEIDALCNIALPTHGLITNVGKAHLEGFGGFEGVIKAKTELYSFLKKNDGLIFCNKNNPYLFPQVEYYNYKYFYGTDSSANIYGEVISDDAYLKVVWNNKSNHYEIITQLTGNYNLENVLAAISIGSFFKVDVEKINSAIANYVPGNQRSQIIKKETNTIVLDAYNANPTSMEEAIRNFTKNFKSNRIVILGDMFELGHSEETEHLAIINLIKQFSFDKVILVGMRFSKHQNQIDALFFNSSDEAVKYLNQNKTENSNILIKGSRSSKMEVVLNSL